MYYNKFLKYKVKYNDKIKNEISSSYKKIDNVLNNLDKVYIEVKDAVQRAKPKILTQKGGKMKDYSNYNYEKIKKYKKFIKYAKSTIIQYRNMINQYHMTALSLNSKYIKVFNLLKSKKEELEDISSNVNILNINNKNNKEKIDLLEATLSLLEKNISNSIDFDVQIEADGSLENTQMLNLSREITKGLNQHGGDIDNVDDFENKMDELMKSVKKEVDINNENIEEIQNRFKSIVNKMNDLADDKTNLNAIKVNLEFIINKLETKEQIDFNQLFNNFNDTLKKATLKQPEELLKYHNEIQKFVSLIDRIVLSNKQIIQTLSEENKKELQAYKQEIQQYNGQIGGKQSGGIGQGDTDKITIKKFKDFFNVKKEKMKELLTKYTDDSNDKLKFYKFDKNDTLKFINFDLSDVDPDATSIVNQNYDIAISIISIFVKLEKILQIFFPIIDKFEKERANGTDPNADLFVPDKIISTWDHLFSFKATGTDFYDTLKNMNIYNIIFKDSSYYNTYIKANDYYNLKYLLEIKKKFYTNDIFNTSSNGNKIIIKLSELLYPGDNDYLLNSYSDRKDPSYISNSTNETKYENYIKILNNLSYTLIVLETILYVIVTYLLNQNKTDIEFQKMVKQMKLRSKTNIYDLNQDRELYLKFDDTNDIIDNLPKLHGGGIFDFDKSNLDANIQKFQEILNRTDISDLHNISSSDLMQFIKAEKKVESQEKKKMKSPDYKPPTAAQEEEEFKKRMENIEINTNQRIFDSKLKEMKPITEQIQVLFTKICNKLDIKVDVLFNNLKKENLALKNKSKKIDDINPHEYLEIIEINKINIISEINELKLIQSGGAPGLVQAPSASGLSTPDSTPEPASGPPTTDPASGLPASGPPTTDPASGLPASGPPTTDPASGLPASGLPASGPPTTDPASGLPASGPPTTGQAPTGQTDPTLNQGNSKLLKKLEELSESYDKLELQLKEIIKKSEELETENTNTNQDQIKIKKLDDEIIELKKKLIELNENIKKINEEIVSLRAKSSAKTDKISLLNENIFSSEIKLKNLNKSFTEKKVIFDSLVDLPEPRDNNDNNKTKFKVYIKAEFDVITESINNVKLINEMIDILTKNKTIEKLTIKPEKEYNRLLTLSGSKKSAYDNLNREYLSLSDSDKAPKKNALELSLQESEYTNIELEKARALKEKAKEAQDKVNLIILHNANNNVKLNDYLNKLKELNELPSGSIVLDNEINKYVLFKGLREESNNIITTTMLSFVYLESIILKDDNITKFTELYKYIKKLSGEKEKYRLDKLIKNQNKEIFEKYNNIILYNNSIQKLLDKHLNNMNDNDLNYKILIKNKIMLYIINQISEFIGTEFAKYMSISSNLPRDKSKAEHAAAREVNRLPFYNLFKKDNYIESILDVDKIVNQNSIINGVISITKDTINTQLLIYTENGPLLKDHIDKIYISSLNDNKTIYITEIQEVFVKINKKLTDKVIEVTGNNISKFEEIMQPFFKVQLMGSVVQISSEYTEKIENSLNKILFNNNSSRSIYNQIFGILKPEDGLKELIKENHKNIKTLLEKRLDNINEYKKYGTYIDNDLPNIDKINNLNQEIIKMYNLDHFNMNEKTQHESIFKITMEKINITSETSSSLITTPRIDSFREKLEECRNSMEPYIIAINKIENLSENYLKNLKSDIPKSEQYALKEIYFELNDALRIAKINFINVLPMIFLMTEFNPQIYKEELKYCRYKFSYDFIKEEVNYKLLPAYDGKKNPPQQEFPKDKFNRCDTTPLLLDEQGNIKYENGVKKGPLYTLDSKTLMSTEFIINAHGAFLLDNNKIDTDNIFGDPNIGVKVISQSKLSEDSPINKILYMLFPIGTSGTGKTFRLFGSKTADDANKSGIINSTLKDYAKDKKNEISVAYFILYGRKRNVSDTIATINHNFNDKINFDEIVLFFKYTLIKKYFDEKGQYKNPPPPSKKLDDDESCFEAYTQDYKSYVDGTNKFGKTEDGKKDITKYTDFYVNLVNKKLKEIKDFNQIKDFLQKGTNLVDVPIDPTEIPNNFKQILEKKDDLFYTISDVAEIDTLFSVLAKSQKIMQSILPTKNNIESSRGHTCVLIKIKQGDNISYIPVFDMAGTENVKKIFEFITTDFEPTKIYKIMKTVNKLSYENEIDIGLDTKNKFTSLNDMVTNNFNIKKYAYGSKTPPLDQVLTGGDIKVGDIYAEENLKQGSTEFDFPTLENPIALYLQKIINEGHYINHTIAMLLVTSLLIGLSIKATKTGDNDDFEEIINIKDPDPKTNPNNETKFMIQFKEFACLMKETIRPSNPCEKNSTVMLDEVTYNNILNSDCLWMQVLYSFIYWNTDSNKSIGAILKNEITNNLDNQLTKLSIDSTYKPKSLYGTYLLDETFRSKLLFENLTSKELISYNFDELIKLVEEMQIIIKKNIDLKAKNGDPTFKEFEYLELYFNGITLENPYSTYILTPEETNLNTTIAEILSTNKSYKPVGTKFELYSLINPIITKFNSIDILNLKDPLIVPTQLITELNKFKNSSGLAYFEPIRLIYKLINILQQGVNIKLFNKIELNSEYYLESENIELSSDLKSGVIAVTKDRNKKVTEDGTDTFTVYGEQTQKFNKILFEEFDIHNATPVIWTEGNVNELLKKSAKKFHNLIDKINILIGNAQVNKLKGRKNDSEYYEDNVELNQYIVSPYIQGRIKKMYETKFNIASDNLTDILQKMKITELNIDNENVMCTYHNRTVKLLDFIKLLKLIKEDIQNGELHIKDIEPGTTGDQNDLKLKYKRNDQDSMITNDSDNPVIKDLKLKFRENAESIVIRKLYNEINRVKHARINTTKQIAFLTGTGQLFKHPMVIDTFDLYTALYKSIDFKLKKIT
jgi:hypothetical protein